MTNPTQPNERPADAVPSIPSREAVHNLEPDVLHVLRNPHGFVGDDLRKYRLRAADEIEELRATIERLERTVAEQAAALAAKQAHIDRLMLEYCPDEMTPEQLDEWGRRQVRCSPEEEAAIKAALASQPSISSGAKEQEEKGR